MSDKEALLTKKKELEERLEKIKRDIGQKLSADSEEQATELENRDVILEIARVTEEELAAVNAEINGTNNKLKQSIVTHPSRLLLSVDQTGPCRRI